MSNSPPLGIITDQKKAMKNAIEIVFSNIRHRWCLWHILKKVPKKLGRYAKYDTIRVSLHVFVYYSQTPIKFEEVWHDMLDKYDLGDNQWLNGLYEKDIVGFHVLLKLLFGLAYQLLNVMRV